MKVTRRTRGLEDLNKYLIWNKSWRRARSICLDRERAERELKRIIKSFNNKFPTYRKKYRYLIRLSIIFKKI